MELLRINAENPDRKLVSYAAEKIKEGKIVIYPTDTVYGIGCSISNLDSVRRIYDIKKRNRKKPLSIAFPDLETAKKYVFLDEREETFLRKHLDKPFTFIVRRKKNVPDAVTAGKDDVGIRIPDHKVLRQILYCAGMPVITTSANISGLNPPSSVNTIDKEVASKADVIIDSGPCRIGVPSRVINIRTGEILR